MRCFEVVETVSVMELINWLEQYPSDLKVFYSTKYALTPFTLRVIENKYLIIEMSDEFKELFGNE